MVYTLPFITKTSPVVLPFGPTPNQHIFYHSTLISMLLDVGLGDSRALSTALDPRNLFSPLLDYWATSL
jgi:hypothetical protein